MFFPHYHFLGDVHRNPDRASPSAAVADGGSADLSPAVPGPRRAHPLPSSLLQDPQQGAASAGVPAGLAAGPSGSGPLQLSWQRFQRSTGQKQRHGGQTGD